MASWYVPVSLLVLRKELDDRWPDRDRRSDGTIGDADHAARKSDHNPDRRGCIHARDIDADGVHVPTVLAALMLHPSTSYVIHNRRTWARWDLYRPRRYIGSNPHKAHIHESIQYSSSAESSLVRWSPITMAVGSPTVPPTIAKGSLAAVTVRYAQALLNGQGSSLVLDGDFGIRTLAETRVFQTWAKISVDGIIGPVTWSRLTTMVRGWS